MKVKLDENLGRRTIDVFRTASHDVATVHDEGLAGASDPQVRDAAVAEGRMLVTLTWTSLTRSASTRLEHLESRFCGSRLSPASRTSCVPPSCSARP
ncbi:MAG: DUF5615 family PIN-like protein [Acidimicrobiales bacterium]